MIFVSIVKKLSYCLLLIASLFFVACGNSKKIAGNIIPVTATDKVWETNNIVSFEKEIETFRVKYHIPGLSAGIVNGKKLVWSKGFGYADIESKIVPDENTVY